MDVIVVIIMAVIFFSGIGSMIYVSVSTERYRERVNREIVARKYRETAERNARMGL